MPNTLVVRLPRVAWTRRTARNVIREAELPLNGKRVELDGAGVLTVTRRFAEEFVRIIYGAGYRNISLRDASPYLSEQINVAMGTYEEVEQ